MSNEAFSEFEALEDFCIKTQDIMQAGNIDSWSYIWGNDAFTVKKAYMTLIGYQPAPPHFNWIWKSSCQARHKLFFWYQTN
jgi:hypothetical protein